MLSKIRAWHISALGMAVLGALAIGFVVTAAAAGMMSDSAESGRPIPPGAVTAPGQMTDEQRAQRFQAGPVWDGKGTGPWTMTDVKRFSDYGLFWPGSSFGPYNLQAVGHTKYDPPKDIPNGHSQDMVTFIYGKCTPDAGIDRCLAPASIQIQPACLVPPSLIAESAKVDALGSVRGDALIQRFTDGHARIWTGDSVIRIDSPANPALVDKAILELQSVNSDGPAAGASLAAPDLSACG